MPTPQTLDIISRDDIISYMVDCMCYSREEADEILGRSHFMDVLSPEQVSEMHAFLGLTN